MAHDWSDSSCGVTWNRRRIERVRRGTRAAYLCGGALGALSVVWLLALFSGLVGARFAPAWAWEHRWLGMIAASGNGIFLWLLKKLPVLDGFHEGWLIEVTHGGVTTIGLFATHFIPHRSIYAFHIIGDRLMLVGTAGQRDHELILTGYSQAEISAIELALTESGMAKRSVGACQ